MNCGFEGLLAEVPGLRVGVGELVQQAGYGEAMTAALRAGGLEEVPVADGRPLPHLVRRALARLAAAIPEMARRACGVVFAHSLPVLAPAGLPFLAQCLEGRGLERIPRVAVGGQPCAVLHWAVQLADAWLGGEASEAGIVVIGADQAYQSADRLFFNSAMGDAVVVGFLTRTAARDRVLASVTRSDIVAAEGVLSDPEDIAHFRELSPLWTRTAIKDCLDRAGVRLPDVTWIIPHTPYLALADTLARVLRFPRERVLTHYLRCTGHMNSNDSFVHYIRAAGEGRFRRGDLALLVNPGFGGTRGCTLLRH